MLQAPSSQASPRDVVDMQSESSSSPSRDPRKVVSSPKRDFAPKSPLLTSTAPLRRANSSQGGQRPTPAVLEGHHHGITSRPREGPSSRGVEKSKSFDNPWFVAPGLLHTESTPRYSLPPRRVGAGEPATRGIGKSKSFDPRTTSNAARYYGTTRYDHVMGYDQPDGIMKPQKRVTGQKFPSLFRRHSNNGGGKESNRNKPSDAADDHITTTTTPKQQMLRRFSPKV